MAKSTSTARRSITGVRRRIHEQCRQRTGPRGECTLPRQLARCALPRYGLYALQARHRRWRKRGRAREKEERARGRRRGRQWALGPPVSQREHCALGYDQRIFKFRSYSKFISSVESHVFVPNRRFFHAAPVFTLWFFTTYCPLTKATSLLRNIFLTQLLTNLEDDIFLKGDSVVTPQKFGLVLMN